MKRVVLIVAVACVFVGNALAQTLQAPFVHPGLNHTQADLDRMKEKVLAGESPWIDGWNALCDFRDSQSDFGASPKPTIGGSDGTRQRASRDAMAAYYNILRWYVTGEEAHARCAVDLLNDWSSAVQSVVTGELFMLPACDFMKAAELVRLYPGWKEEDRERFEKMARDYIYPACRDFRDEPGTWPGWDGPANTACLYIGVFLDDAEMVNDAIEYYKTGKGGGCITEGIVFGGQPVEMGRDQPHAVIGLDSYADFCQVLWNQGTDMFSYQDNLLLKGFEYYAKFNLEQPVDWTPIDYHGHKFYYSAPSSNAPSSMPNNRILANELVYHHYVDRMGGEAPWLREMMKLKNVDVLTGMMYTFSDTTTAYEPYPVPSVPSGLTAESGLRRVAIDWERERTANGYDVQRSVSPDGGFETIAGWSGNATSEYADTAVVPGQTYYYRVRAKNRSGEGGWTEPVAATPVAGSTTSFLGGWTHADIGKEDWMPDGETWYAPENGNSFRVLGSGRDIYNPDHPEGNFTYTAVTGDFELVARVYEGEQNGNEIKVKFGLAVRESVSSSSPKVMLWVGDAGTRQMHFMWRNTGSGDGDIQGSDHTWIPVWLRLSRKGEVFEASVSVDGVEWHSVGSSTISFPDDCLAGVWVCGGAYLPMGYTAGFDHVSLKADGMARPAVPTEFQAEAAGSTSLALSWTASGNVSAYRLDRGLSPDGPFETLATNLSSTSYVDGDLEPGTTYHYRLWSSNAAGESEVCATASAATDELSLPDAPVGVEAYGGNGYVGLSWQPSGERTAYYQVRRGNIFGGPYTLIGRTTETQYTDHKVDNGQMYYYVVSAVNAVGEGAESAEAKACPQVGGCQYWPFEDGGGSVVSDVWNGGDAQLVNNVRFGSGRFLSGVSLNGGYVAFPPGWANTWRNFTLSVWVKPDDVLAWARVVDCSTGTDNNFFLTLKAAQTGCMRYAIKKSGTSEEQQINTTFCPKSGEWTHIVLVQEGSTGILYANGVEVGRNGHLTLAPADLGTTLRNYVGRSAYDTDPYFYGSVDELRVYDCALNAVQVASLYQVAVQQVTFNELPEKHVGDADFRLAATASSGRAVSFESANPRVAEITDGNQVRLLSAGTSDITAMQVGNLQYAASAPVVRTLTVGEGDGVEPLRAGGTKWTCRVEGGHLCVDFGGNPFTGTVALFASDGKQAGMLPVDGGQTCLMPVGGLPSGLYFLKVWDREGHAVVHKIVL